MIRALMPALRATLVAADDPPARGLEVEPACHGWAPAPTASCALARHHRQDPATGFDAGDLRGALWFEVQAPPTRRPHR